MKETQMMVRKNVFSMVVLTGSVLLGACTSTAPTQTPTPEVTTASPIPTPTPTPTQSEDPVVAAVKATIIGYYKDEDYLAQNPGSPDMYRVQRWTTGESLSSSVRGVGLAWKAGRREGDTVIRDIKVYAPPVDKGAGLEITAVYCIDSQSARIIKADGSSVPLAIPTLENTSVLRFVDGLWRIDTNRNVDPNGEVKSC